MQFIKDIIKAGMWMLIICMPVFLMGQNWTAEDSIEYYELIDKAEGLYYDEIGTAWPAYDEAIGLAKTYELHQELLYLQMRKAELSVYHFEYDSAVYLLTQNDNSFHEYANLLDSTEKYILPRHHTTWLYYLNRIGNDREVMHRARVLIDTINQGYGGHYGPYHLTVAQNYLAVALKRQGRLEEAEAVLESGIKQSIALDDRDQENAFYKQLADIKLLQGKFDEGKNIYDRAFQWVKKSYSAEPKNYLASRAVSISRAISEGYKNEGIYDSASFYLKQAAPFLKLDSFLFMEIQIERAELDINQGQNVGAKLKLNSAIKFGQSESTNNPVLSRAQLKMATVLRLEEKIVEAANFLSLAEKGNRRNQQFIDPVIGIEILSEKAKQLNSKKESIDERMAIYQEIYDITNALRLNANTAEDRVFLTTKITPIFEEILFDLSSSITNGSEGYDQSINLALQVIEAQKAVNLLGAIRDMPNELNENNTSLQLLKKIDQARDDWADSKELLVASGVNNRDSIEVELINHRNNYFKLSNELRSENSDFFKHKFSISETILKDLKRKSDALEMSIVSYYWGENDVYEIKVNKHRATLRNCGKTNEFAALIDEQRRIISDPKKTFVAGSTKEIYDRLLGANGEIYGENILLLPDGPLYHFPFEILQIEDRFLIEKYAIHYNYSASIWMSLMADEESKYNDGDLIAFAPDFKANKLLAGAENTRELLGPLAFNKKEAKDVSNIFDGRIYNGLNATKKKFLNEYRGANIIHLATHALTYDDRPGQSFLAFSGAESGAESNKLLLSEIYALQTKASLISLSACETGYGPTSRGEGVISLASAFQHSGAAALLTSLWKVNDESTSQLMEAFYKHLASGDSKTSALRNAKIEYLKTLNKDQRHPAYWASFVLYGDESAITNGGLGFGRYSWILGGIVLLFLVLLLRRRR